MWRFFDDFVHFASESATLRDDSKARCAALVSGYITRLSSNRVRERHQNGACVIRNSQTMKQHWVHSMKQPCVDQVLNGPALVQRLAMFGLVMSVLLSAESLAQDRLAPDWVRVSEAAGWQPRDSQGEVVFRDQLWVMGGWFDSFSAPPRDVWSSADGRQWKQVEKSAPWIHSDLPMSLVFKDRMWMMGGWYNGRLDGHSASNQVWSSTDGAKWEQATATADWSPRIAAATVEFRGRMWILGGTENYYFGDDKSLKNDVWSSADGKAWNQETAAAEWSPRAYHQAVVLNDRIYLFGGGNYVPKYQANNEVWSSGDGVHWTRETKAAPWHARLWFSAAVYRDHIFVIGGWSNNPSTNWGDVWCSRNGRQWQRLKSNVIWKERHEHSVFVFQDKLWIAGGHAKPLSSEVWSLELPQDFFEKK